LVLGCAMSVSASAQEATPGDIATAIRALEHQWAEGQAHNDNRALDRIFDNALVYVEYGRLVTKGEYLSRIRAAKPGPSQIVNEAMTVRLFGDTAIVVGTYLEKTGSAGKTMRWRFVDTWVYKSGRWMLVAAGASLLEK
jgi:hypothetical protein